MIVVGVLSGTSVDAIDVAVARFVFGGNGVLAMRPMGHQEHAWPAGLRARVLAALPPAEVAMAEVCALDNDIGRAFAQVVVSAVAELAAGRADLVASLGQTVFHDVRADGRCHGTLQLGQAAWIAEATGLPVVSDLRAADVAAGGHGAPLASTMDALWLGPSTVALNLGGIANVTVVRDDGVLAFDTGPANCLLDVTAAGIGDGGLTCDLGGALAATGTVRADLLAELLDEPYFDRPPPKSCGRELFHAGYVARAVARVPAVAPGDLMATLTELTAVTVARAVAPYGPREVVVSGGGVHNPVLLAALRRHLPGPVWRTSDERGLPSGAKEAYLVTLLGALSWHNLPGSLPSATGARHRAVLGRVTPARAAPATATPPTRLRLGHPPR
jgi:anhydro-N-acetylmuramic acid kinase